MTTTAEKKKSKKKAAIVPNARGKRKEAIARAVIVPGNGKVYINRMLASTMNDPQVREIIAELMHFLADRDKVDIKVATNGGGSRGQAQAIRTAIAKAIVEYTKSDELHAEIIAYDRSMLVDDARRVEPKKFKGPKARARFTKSYR